MSYLYKNRKPVWYNLVTQNTYDNKPPKLLRKNCLYFPSTSEYKLFVMLKAVLPSSLKIHTQKQLSFGIDKWRLDFMLSSSDERHKKLFAGLLHTFNRDLLKYEIDNPETIYIEYKSIKDKNFIEKQKSLKRYSSLDYRVLLVSDKEDIIKFDLYTKRIIGLQSFREAILKLNQNYDRRN